MAYGAKSTARAPRIGRTWGRFGTLFALSAAFEPILGSAAWAASFQAAPKAAESEGGASTETILGYIHVNTAFFIVVGVVAVYWFLFGGGRKVKLGRKE